MKVIDVYLTGKKIKSICVERKIKPNQLAEFLGFSSAAAIYKWFEGRGIPSIDNLVLVAELFNLSVEELLVMNDVDCQLDVGA